MTANVSYQEEWAAKETPREALVAKLAQAAYAVALGHGRHLPFTDLELALWRELRAVLDRELAGVNLGERAGDAA
ncbi:hypothetical protein [Limnoglobus roseus]|uniref:Uncharacterized protein n=1 Tax=Limnoglobus roseus TaxID=2598579 RepID=A0A5C1A9B0_9BACT|nr:hypothetical protein [Limnoglobus roseus]QEL15310.1 hypothetical protein PX52LOC_02225 [Limnoglobus roseus]